MKNKINLMIAGLVCSTAIISTANAQMCTTRESKARESKVVLGKGRDFWRNFVDNKNRRIRVMVEILRVFSELREEQ